MKKVLIFCKNDDIKIYTKNGVYSFNSFDPENPSSEDKLINNICTEGTTHEDIHIQVGDDIYYDENSNVIDASPNLIKLALNLARDFRGYAIYEKCQCDGYDGYYVCPRCGALDIGLYMSPLDSRVTLCRDCILDITLKRNTDYCFYKEEEVMLENVSPLISCASCPYPHCINCKVIEKKLNTNHTSDKFINVTKKIRPNLI